MLVFVLLKNIKKIVVPVGLVIMMLLLAAFECTPEEPRGKALQPVYGTSSEQAVVQRFVQIRSAKSCEPYFEVEMTSQGARHTYTIVKSPAGLGVGLVDDPNNFNLVRLDDEVEMEFEEGFKATFDPTPAFNPETGCFESQDFAVIFRR